MSISLCCRTYNFVLAPVDGEREGVFAREFVVTINGRQEMIDLDVHYRGHSLGEPADNNLQKLLIVYTVHTSGTCLIYL